MDLRKCENGHFFDIERFDECPHCSGVAKILNNRKEAKENIEPLIKDSDQDRNVVRVVNKEQCIHPEITHVHSYFNGSSIFCNGEVKLQKGLNTIYLIYANRIDTDSLKIEIDGISNSDYQILTKKFISYSYDIEEVKEDKRHKKQILDEYDEKIKELNLSIRLKREELEIWKQNVDLTKRPAVTVEETEKLMNAFIRNTEEIGKEILKLEKEKKQVEEEKNNFEINEKSNSTPQNIYMGLCLKVNAPQEGDYEVKYSYFDKWVTWEPIYKISTISDRPEALVTLQGKLKRDLKGEKIAWKDATMVLSLGQLHAEKPILMKWEIGHKPIANYKMSEEFLGEDLATMPLAAPNAFVVEEEPKLEIKEGLFKDYILPGKYELEDFADEKIIDILSFTLPIRNTYYAVPKLSGQVYQTVEIAEPNDSPFFSCNARLYNENEYVGEIKIKDHMANGVLRFPLGIEPEISISRTLQKGYVKNKILKGNNQYVGSYIIELHNRKKMQANIIVEDQLPVSVDSNVHVRGSFSLPGKVNEKTGIITWNLMMMPNEKLEIKTEIVIDASKDSGIGSDVFWRM